MTQRYIKILLCLSIFFLAGIPNVHAAGAEFTRNINKEIKVDDPASVSVTEVHTLDWQGTSTYFPAGKNFQYFTIVPPFLSQTTDFDKQVTDIVVTDDKGKSLSFTKTIENGILTLKVAFYRDLLPGNKLVYTLKYKTTLLTRKDGGVLEVIHSAISKDFQERRRSSSGTYDEIFKISYAFKISQSLGTPDFIFPESKNVQKQGGYTTINYTHTDLIDNAVRITIGKKRLVKFTLHANVSKTNSDTHELVKNFVTNTVQLVLPSDYTVSGQQIFFSKISPFPTKVTIDADGNLLADIPINATEDGQVTIEGYAEITRQTIQPDGLYKWKISDIPDSLKSYTQESLPDWPTNAPQIKQIIPTLVDKDGSILKTTQNAVKFVTSTLEYRKFSSTTELRRLGALGALQSKQGVCMEYSDLLLTLLRSMGIASRNIYGDGVGSLTDRSINGIGHQWVEVWVPEQGWIPVDPTWSENGYVVLGPDLDHFMWYKTTESPDKPSGFSCETWDKDSPCEQGMTIDTLPVDSLPDAATLMTQTQLIDKIKAQPAASTIPFVTDIFTYLGNSYVGRLLFNSVMLNIILAILSYLLIFGILRIIYKIYKRYFKKPKAPPKLPIP